jgi:SAM-dependent methyltransferase
MNAPAQENNPVQDHYGDDSLAQRVDQALERMGLGTGALDWRALAPLDQFHVRGLAASEEMAAGLGVRPGEAVLDVGCGLGGPARFLAATRGCRVTGIDLSRPFVEVARGLTERTGLSELVAFEQGDALALPFADGSFECAWTQHVAMNIADRGRLYAEIHRVLKPGGRLAIYDVTAGETAPLLFPVPWARTPEISFLLTPAAMRATLEEAGFSVISWEDKTAAGLAWFAAQTAAAGPGRPPSPPGLEILMGPEFAGMAANLGRNLREGRIGLTQAIVRA